MLYDFEAFQDKTQRKEVTATLTFENTHVPISVSVGETLEKGPTHICDANPKELLRKFMEEVEIRGKIFGPKYERSTYQKMRTCFQKGSTSKSRNGATRCRLLGSTLGITI